MCHCESVVLGEQKEMPPEFPYGNRIELAPIAREGTERERDYGEMGRKA